MAAKPPFHRGRRSTKTPTVSEHRPVTSQRGLVAFANVHHHRNQDTWKETTTQLKHTKIQSWSYSLAMLTTWTWFQCEILWTSIEKKRAEMWWSTATNESVPSSSGYRKPHDPPLSKDSSHPPLWLVIHGTVGGSEIPNNHRLDGAKTL